MNDKKIVTELTHKQADGLACVVCGVEYLHVHVPHVPVGRSTTGSQIFACVTCRLGAEHAEPEGALR